MRVMKFVEHILWIHDFRWRSWNQNLFEIGEMNVNFKTWKYKKGLEKWIKGKICRADGENWLKFTKIGKLITYVHWVAKLGLRVGRKSDSKYIYV